jgi:hypothetical protein
MFVPGAVLVERATVIRRRRVADRHPGFDPDTDAEAHADSDAETQAEAGGEGQTRADRDADETG